MYPNLSKRKEFDFLVSCVVKLNPLPTSGGDNSMNVKDLHFVKTRFFEIYKNFVEFERPLEPEILREMKIELYDLTAFSFSPRRLSAREKEIVDEVVLQGIADGHIRRSESPYASPIVLLQRKTEIHDFAFIIGI